MSKDIKDSYAVTPEELSQKEPLALRGHLSKLEDAHRYGFHDEDEYGFHPHCPECNGFDIKKHLNIFLSKATTPEQRLDAHISTMKLALRHALAADPRTTNSQIFNNSASNN
jgi:hypothetical protein